MCSARSVTVILLDCRLDLPAAQGVETHPAVGRRQIIDDLLPTRRLSTTRWWQFVLVRESLEDAQEYEHDGGRNGDDHRGAPHRRCDPVPPMPFYIVFRQ